MIGIDEVGRGALAGPLIVAGYYFTQNPISITGLDDSKKLTANKRQRLDSLLRSNGLFHIVEIPADDIDKLGLTVSLKSAILKIVSSMPEDAPIQMDGKYNFLQGTKYEVRAFVEPKADAKYMPVMAASIIAKVYRDNLMIAYDRQYKDYGFARNVGYGTTDHLDALQRLGPSPIHRRSFKPLKSQTKGIL